MNLSFLNSTDIHVDLSKEEFLEIVNDFINQKKKAYKKFLQQQRGVGS